MFIILQPCFLRLGATDVTSPDYVHRIVHSGESHSSKTAGGVRHEKTPWVEDVPPDGRSAKLALVEVGSHVGSGGAEVADEHDGRRNVDHVQRREIF